MFCIFSRCLTEHIMSIIVLQVLCEPSRSLTVILTLCAVDNSSSIIYGHTHILFILSYRHTCARTHTHAHTHTCMCVTMVYAFRPLSAPNMSVFVASRG